MKQQEAWIFGRLGRDSERRYLPNGNGVLSFSVAVDGDDEGQENGKGSTTWWNCSLFERDFRGEVQWDLEALEERLVKGAVIFAVGTPRARAYLHKDSGEARASLDLNIRKLELPTPTHAPERENGTAVAAPAGQQSLDEVPF